MHSHYFPIGDKSFLFPVSAFKYYYVVSVVVYIVHSPLSMCLSFTLSDVTPLLSNVFYLFLYTDTKLRDYHTLSYADLGVLASPLPDIAQN